MTTTECQHPDDKVVQLDSAWRWCSVCGAHGRPGWWKLPELRVASEDSNHVKIGEEMRRQVSELNKEVEMFLTTKTALRAECDLKSGKISELAKENDELRQRLFEMTAAKAELTSPFVKLPHSERAKLSAITHNGRRSSSKCATDSTPWLHNQL